MLKRRFLVDNLKQNSNIIPVTSPLAEDAFLFKKTFFLQEDELMYPLQQQLFFTSLFAAIKKQEGWQLLLNSGSFISFYSQLYFAQVIPFKVDFAFPESVFEFWSLSENSLFYLISPLAFFKKYFWASPDNVDFIFFGLSTVSGEFNIESFVVCPVKFTLPVFYLSRVFVSDFIYNLIFSKESRYIQVYSYWLFDYPFLGLYLDDYLFRLAVWYDYSDTFL